MTHTIDFIIAGAQKSASSFVHACLSDHPQIVMPKYESPCFESPFYERGALKILTDEFESHQRAATITNYVFGIKCPDFLAKPECAHRINEHCPDTRIILVLRDPLERLISAVYWYQQIGLIPVAQINHVISKLEDPIFLEKYPRAKELIDYGIYAEHVSRFFELFDQRQLFLIEQAELKSQPLVAMQKLYQFLNIDVDHQSAALFLRPKKGIYNPIRLRYLALINQLFYQFDLTKSNQNLDWRRNNKVLDVIYKLLLLFDRSILSRMVNNRKSSLTDQSKLNIQNLYGENILKLQTLLQWDLNDWMK